MILVNSAPSGSCNAGVSAQLVASTGIIYTCQSGTWGQSGGTGGPFLALAGGTMTGTITGSDGGTWSTTGFSTPQTITSTNTGTGTLTLNGSTSGAATIAAPAVAGTTTNAVVSSNTFQAPNLIDAGVTGFGYFNGSSAATAATATQLGTLANLAANAVVKSGGTSSALTVSSITDNGTTVSTTEPSQAAGFINVTTPIRDETRFVLVSNMTAVSTAGVNIGSTGASNVTFSWPVTAANWYDLQCKLPVTFATTATVKFQLVSISGSSTISNVNSETMGDTGAAGVFQDLATIAGTSLATSTTPITGAPGASETVTYNAQFLSSHAGNIGLEFIANGTNNITMLLGGECGLTQIN
jgi:hypothetical protein